MVSKKSGLALPQVSAGYYQFGDTIRVKGIFHKNCPEHNGESDIHAQALAVIKKGGKKPEYISVKKKEMLALSFIFFLFSLLVLFYYKFYVARIRKNKARG